MKIRELVFASHNQGKIAEIRRLLEPLGVVVFSADDMSFPDVEETGTTFEENATLKALSIAKYTGKPCLADDSGLCVSALNGRPGVYTARYVPDRDYARGMAKLLNEIESTGNSDRSAYFACVLVLGLPDAQKLVFEGRSNGHIALECAGVGGFGFDPVFIPEGYDQTFAQLGADVKNKISHRGRAMEKLIRYFKENQLS